MRVVRRAGSGRRFRLASWLGRRVRRAATGTGMLALAVPLAWPSGAGGQHLPVPTPTSVRSEVVRLADWVVGDSPPPPSVPAQRAGKAPGRQHQVPAAVTRAIARAEGRAASQAPGQLPLYTFPGARVKQHVTGRRSSRRLAGTQPASPPAATPTPTPAAATPPAATPPARRRPPPPCPRRASRLRPAPRRLAARPARPRGPRRRLARLPRPAPRRAPLPRLSSTRSSATRRPAARRSMTSGRPTATTPPR